MGGVDGTDAVREAVTLIGDVKVIFHRASPNHTPWSESVPGLASGSPGSVPDEVAWFATAALTCPNRLPERSLNAR